jgi:hypothetical protein
MEAVARVSTDRLEMHAPGQSAHPISQRGRREWIVRRVDLRNRLRKGSADVAILSASPVAESETHLSRSRNIRANATGGDSLRVLCH